MEKVIVTGGAGFIGSHLVEELAKRGYQVTILDDLSTGKKENIEPFLKQGIVDFTKGSITDLPLLKNLFKDALYVFHHAALAGVPQSINDPLTANKVNITGSLNVLLAARDNGIQKVVFASSAAVYGETTVLPQRENLPPNPLSPYALTKLAAEYYCEIFRQIYGLSTVSLRYFNVYGTRQDPFSPYASAITAFRGRISQNLPPVIFGDGEQSRDLVFITDVVAANILAAENNAEGVFNIGSGRSTTINQLADLTLKLAGKDMKPVYQEPRPSDPRQSLADISRARSFGYEPKYSLEEGLQLTLDGLPS
ncbi:SDR family oxidoreductase [Chloroflexota bacterium]